MSHKRLNLRAGVLVSLIFLAVFSRFIPHLPNFTPIGAIALFGAAYFSKRYLAFLIPFVALWLSNLILDNVFLSQYYDSFQWMSHPSVYIGMGLIVLFGFFSLKKITPLRVVGSGVAASLIFFLVSNFGSWLGMPIYTKDLTGLITCYTAALPFFWSTFAADLVYTVVLFGSFELIKRSVPQVGLAAESGV